MPRQPRKTGITGIYHVIFRGNNHQDIFHENTDMLKMYRILKDSIVSAKIQIHAYCLMTNHVHLLIQILEDADGNALGDIMKYIEQRYVYYYNKKYDCIGTLYQSRYISEPVDDNRYYLAVMRYIHNNPVAAKIVKMPHDYQWSSYNDYVHNTGFTCTALAKSMLGNQFESFSTLNDNKQYLDIDYQRRNMTDLHLSALIFNEHHINVPAIASMERKNRNKILRSIYQTYNVSYRQLSRITGLSKYVISNAINKN